MLAERISTCGMLEHVSMSLSSLVFGDFNAKLLQTLAVGIDDYQIEEVVVLGVEESHTARRKCLGVG